MNLTAQILFVPCHFAKFRLLSLNSSEVWIHELSNLLPPVNPDDGWFRCSRDFGTSQSPLSFALSKGYRSHEPSLGSNDCWSSCSDLTVQVWSPPTHSSNCLDVDSNGLDISQWSIQWSLFLLLPSSVSLKYLSAKGYDLWSFSEPSSWDLVCFP